MSLVARSASLSDSAPDRSQTVADAQATRLAFIVDGIEGWGGTELQLLEILRALALDGFECHVFFLFPSPAAECCKFPCATHFLNFVPNGPASRLNLLRKLSSSLCALEPQMVQTVFASAAYYGTAAGLFAGVRKIVATRRNDGYWKTRWDKLLLPIVNRFVDIWQCNSETVAESLMQHEGIRRDRIAILSNSIDLERYVSPCHEERIAARRKLGLHLEGRIFVCVANLRPVKDHRTVVEAAAIVSNKLPNPQFLLVGDGPLRSELECCISRSGLKNSFYLAGYQGDVRPFLSAADVGVLASRAEGSSNSVLEYMGMGLPSVLSDIPANRELVSGLFFKLGDARDLANKLLCLCADHDLYRRLADEYVSRSRLFGRDEFRRHAREFYSSLALRCC